MPAGPIGAVWAAGSWTDTCWEVGTWADEGAVLSPGDNVQVLISGGIQCTVFHNTGTPVRVVTASTKQISVLISGGTPIKVTI